MKYTRLLDLIRSGEGVGPPLAEEVEIGDRALKLIVWRTVKNLGPLVDQEGEIYDPSGRAAPLPVTPRNERGLRHYGMRRRR